MNSWITVVGLVAAAIGVICYLVPYALKAWQRAALRARTARSRAVVLTYDDGPSADITPALLDLLSRHGAKATFFVLGSRAGSHPELIDRIVAEGHELGCHSQNHYHPWTTPPWLITRDMEAGYHTLARWMRQDGPFRPPYGKPFLPALIRLARRGSMPAWWTIDSGDTSRPRPSFQRTLEAVRKTGGGVILMHDFRAGDPTHRDYVLSLTEIILDLVQAEGLRVQRLRDLESPSGDTEARR